MHPSHLYRRTFNSSYSSGRWWGGRCLTIAPHNTISVLNVGGYRQCTLWQCSCLLNALSRSAEAHWSKHVHIPAPQEQRLKYTHTNKHTQTCAKQKHWIVVQLYKLIWIWCVSLPEALDVCTFCVCVCGGLCWGSLMLCDWGQCCQQSRDMDAAQVPPCINVGAGKGCSSSSPAVWHLKVQSAILGARQFWVHTHRATLKTTLSFSVRRAGGKVQNIQEMKRGDAENNARWPNSGWIEGKKRYVYFISS